MGVYLVSTWQTKYDKQVVVVNYLKITKNINAA